MRSDPTYLYADSTVSSVLPLLELNRATGERKRRAADFTVRLLREERAGMAAIEWIRHWHAADGAVALSLARYATGLLARFPGIVDFYLSETGAQLDARAYPHIGDGTVRHLLLNQMLPRLLGNQGKLVLHASAVTVGGGVIAFVGKTGCGKSTLAASLHRAGYAPFADDALLVTSEHAQVMALSAYPGLRLCPSSLTALFGDSSSFASAALDGTKRYVMLPRGGEGALPLAAVYLLSEAPQNDPQTVTLSRLSSRDASIALIRHSFQLDIGQRDPIDRLLTRAADVARQTPVYSLKYARDFARLPALGEVIVSQHSVPAGRTIREELA